MGEVSAESKGFFESKNFNNEFYSCARHRVYIAEDIALLMKTKKITVEELAAKSNCTVDELNTVLSGDARNLTVNFLVKICIALECYLDVVFREVQPKKAETPVWFDWVYGILWWCSPWIVWAMITFS